MGIIRLLLAFSVVAAHTNTVFGLTLVGGDVAVQAFFIISGFYMALILNEKYPRSVGSYKLFITNRFLRLYPIFWTTLLCCIGLTIFLLLLSHGHSYGPFQAYADFFHSSNAHAISFTTILFLVTVNLFLFGQDIAMFLGLNTQTGNLFFTKNFQLTNPKIYTFLLVPQAWSLGVELLFYLIAPFIVRKKTWIVVTILILSLVTRWVFYHQGLRYDPWTYRFFPLEITFFLLGSLAYRLYVKIEAQTHSLLVLYILFTLVLLMTTAYPFLDFSYKEVFYYITLTICLPFIFLLTKNNKKDRYIGDLSYPVYITHILIITAISFISYPVWMRGSVTAIFAVLFSIVLNKYITSPIEKFRQRRVMRARATALPVI